MFFFAVHGEMLSHRVWVAVHTIKVGKHIGLIQTIRSRIGIAVVRVVVGVIFVVAVGGWWLGGVADLQVHVSMVVPIW